MPRIFISHATADRNFVKEELLGLLVALGFEPWFSEVDIQGAEQWERSIVGALKSSKWLILVASRESEKSEWVRDELALALEEIPNNIIPIVIGDCELSSFHIRLPRLQYLDFRSQIKEGRERLIKLLVEREYRPLIENVNLDDPLSRQRHKFWSPLHSSGLQIVLGRFLTFSSFEHSGFIGVGDAIGMTELLTSFESIGIRRVPISYADKLDGDAIKTNLILLGGPDANALTKEVVKRVRATLCFGDPDRHEISLHDSETGTVFIPKVGAKSLETDYGIIYFVKNPFAPMKRVVLAAGSFGYGTWAAVRFVLSPEFLENPLVRSGNEVECLIETEIFLDSPQSIKVQAVRKVDTGC